MSSQVATGKVIDMKESCAKVLPYRKLKISPEGEILVQGETLFKGYITGAVCPSKICNSRCFCQESKREQFWFPTGDMGQLDKEGFLTVTGRRDKDVYFRGRKYPSGRN